MEPVHRIGPRTKAQPGNLRSDSVTTDRRYADAGKPEVSVVGSRRVLFTVRLRGTTLTYGFSKKLANLKAAVAVFVAWCNFCRVHQTLRVTPAMEAGLTDHAWSVRELLTAA